MVETTRRSRRNTDTTPCVTAADKTDFVPGQHSHLPKYLRPGPVPVPPDNSPAVSTNQVPQVPDSKFSAAKLAERRSKRHSFRVPDLPVISSLSEVTDSDGSSSSAESESTSSVSDRTDPLTRARKKKRHASGPRLGQDERFPDYLLSLAAKTAERQLREQAMAAYPNEYAHEPIVHYAIDSDSEESEISHGVGRLAVGDPPEDREGEEEGSKRSSDRRSHRDSTAGFDMAEMKQHQKKLDDQRRQAWAEEQEPDYFTPRVQMKKPGKVEERPGGPSKEVIGWQTDNEIKSMRNAAAPPMAGQSLRFARCESPRNTRLDVYQYPGQRKPTGSESRQHSGLWTLGVGISRRGSPCGLWMGVNHASVQTRPTNIQTGLLTPANERADPFCTSASNASTVTTERSTLIPTSSLPPSPPSSQEEASSYLKPPTSDVPFIDLDEEFDDSFVTQVYNYLSLGYPSLARPYDEELAKVSCTPLDTLRKDDGTVNSKGYVGAPEGTGLDIRGCREGACQRWLALRAYVKEWGKQQLIIRGVEDMAGWHKRDVGRDGAWGSAARKGSWGI